MFSRSRNTIKPGTSPQKPNGTMSPLEEIRQCTSRMKSIIRTIMKSHNDVESRENGESHLKRSPSRSGAVKENDGLSKIGDKAINLDSQFAVVSPKQEEEIIELLRRIAELAVQGEQRAAADDSSVSSEHLEYGNSGNAVFEYFCELNVLGTIINIVTGAAFIDTNKKISKGMKNMEINDGIDADSAESSPANEPNDEQPKRKILPPISIATQAIQSVSILMQNVARVTSLYFILSNNKVDDLINLSLENYSIAEQHRNKKANNQKRQTKKYQSAEMSELTTLFISFLKSLAMRMNSETLQFYLTYPMLNKNDVDFSGIQFPLYARALEFCNPDEDTFVRVTAMNICLNTLRLATTGDPLSTGGTRTLQESLGAKSYENVKNVDRPDKITSPDGSYLHVTKTLPFRERLAICHYVCLPSNVQALTSVTFTKIGQLCGSIEEAIRNMDRIDLTLSDISGSTKYTEDEKKIEELQINRIQLVKQFHDLSADFQDEIFLLEDILAAGLVPLNEQIIEMMFGGVVYPLVLQPLHLYTSYDIDSNKAKTSQVADVSLAKAAFFVIGSMYHFLSHKPFLHLLLTALLHPLAPEASQSLIQTDAPMIVQTYDNGDIQIKTDVLQDGTSLDCYNFGRKSEDLDTNQLVGMCLLSECKYVLSPALAQLYQAEMFPQILKQNSYRRSILACLSGTDGMAVLQPLAIYAMDAILATTKPEILKNILFGGKIRQEWEINCNRTDSDSACTSNSNKSGTENYMVEVIASMCRSVMTTATTPVGLRSLNFNLVASHAICCAILIDKPVKATALKLIEHRRRESASFMSQIPSRLNKKSTQSLKEQQSGNNKNSIDEDLKMDRIFFDPFCDGDKFAVENIVRRLNGNFWDGPAFISVAKDGGMNDLCKLICMDPSAIGSFQTEEALYRCAANSAVAHLQLDAFTRLLKDDFDIVALEKQKGYLGVSAFALFDTNCIEGKKNTDRVLLSPLPLPFSSLLFDEEMSSPTSSDMPQTGSVVQLVGKTAFPCVCEVNKESNSLFTDGEAGVISDGITWQSLWMVLMGKYMILAEPVKNDSGGNGRVITSCPLCCITVEKDDSADILQSTSPARRLLMTHFSPDITPPGLFIIDTSDRDQLVNNDDVQVTRSVMDLWFEDSNAAAKSLKALNSKIVKARSRRGHKIREALAQDDRLRFQSLFHS